MLYEYFNTSNQTSPYFQKHDTFVVDLRSPGCAIVQTFDFKDRCDFVKDNEDCQDAQLFDYTYAYYCGLDPQNNFVQSLGVIVICFWIYYLITAIRVIADSFFCPTLNLVTKHFGISQNLAGITLLSLGNGGPDFFNRITGIGDGYIGTTYSDAMGSAVFNTAFIAGIVMWIRPLNVEPYTFVRDVGFQFLSVSYTDYAIDSDRFVTVVMLGIYILYIFIIAIDQVLLGRQINQSLQRRLDVLVEEAEGGMSGEGDNTEPPPEWLEMTKIQLCFKQVIDTLQPFKREDWEDSGYCGKFWIIMRIPVNIILFAMIPAVNPELVCNGWSKLMNCMHIVIMPQGIIYILAPDMVMFGRPMWMVSLIFTVPVALILLLITNVQRPPRLHYLFGIYAIVGSAFWIRITSIEINHTVDLLGSITLYSKSFLGCTILSWGDSLGDLVSSIEFSRQGYQKMSLASCIAGPFLFLTLGLSFTYMYRGINTPTLPKGSHYTGEVKHLFAASQGSMGENCHAFLNIALVTMLLGASITNFQIRRSLGAQLIISYSFFIVYCLLGENQIIHTFGTDHYEDVSIFFL